MKNPHPEIEVLFISANQQDAENCFEYLKKSGQLEKHYPDGTKVLNYPDGTIANVQPDGTKVLTYPDGTVTNFYPDNYQETFFPDGSLKKVDKNGVVTIDYEDGMKVIKY